MNTIDERFILKGQHFVCSGELEVPILASPVAQIASITPITVLDSTLYTVTINYIDFSFTSGIGATLDQIISGLVSEININETNGSVPVTAANITSTSLKLTADVAGNLFIATTTSNMTITTTTPNNTGTGKISLLIETNENPAVFNNPLNLNLMSGHIKITVYENSSVSMNGGSNGIVSNNNRILKTPATTKFFNSPTIVDIGDELLSIKIFGSPDNATKIAQRNSSVGADFGMFVFDRNKKYIMVFENQDINDIAEIGYSMTFFEVKTTDTLLGE